MTQLHSFAHLHITPMKDASHPASLPDPVFFPCPPFDGSKFLQNSNVGDVLLSNQALQTDRPNAATMAWNAIAKRRAGPWSAKT